MKESNTNGFIESRIDNMNKERFVNVLESCKAHIWLIEVALTDNNAFGELADAIQIVLYGIRNQLDELVMELEGIDKGK